MNYLLTVALNKYSEEAYGQNIDLRMCHYDAMRVEAALSDKYEPRVSLRDQDATADRFKSALQLLSNTTKAGDRVMIFFSGHGTYYDIDRSGSTIRKTGRVLYDRVLWDHEVPPMLQAFKPGVLVIFVTDACHSDSINRNIGQYKYRVRFAPVQGEVKAAVARMDKVRCGTFSISACSIFQTAKENDYGGVFTTAFILAIQRPVTLGQLRRAVSNEVEPLWEQDPQTEYTKAKKLLNQSL